MPKGNKSSTKLVLVNHSGLGRVHVDMEAFFEFSFWLAEELEDLVASWSHVRPPAAGTNRNDRPRADRRQSL